MERARRRTWGGMVKWVLLVAVMAVAGTAQAVDCEAEWERFWQEFSSVHSASKEMPSLSLLSVQHLRGKLTTEEYCHALGSKLDMLETGMQVRESLPLECWRGSRLEHKLRKWGLSQIDLAHDILARMRRAGCGGVR